MHVLRKSVVLSVAFVMGALLVGCSSSKSSHGVSLTQLENKLKSEPSIQQAEAQAPPADKNVVNTLIACVAKAMQQQADPTELKKYVDGKLNLNDIGGKNKGSGNAAQNELKSCVGPAVSSAVSSAKASASTSS